VLCATKRYFHIPELRIDDQSICSDRFPSVARTAIPGVVDYPITNAAKSWRFVSGLMYFAYGLSYRETLGGLYDVLTNLGKKSYREVQN
jgi:hypothetical protein